MAPGLDAGPAPVLLEVALATPPFATLTYCDPRADATALALGTQVVVPLNQRRVTGFVVGAGVAPPAGKNREVEVLAIEEVLEDEPALDPEVLALCRFAAGYYVAPLGEVLRAALPQAERAASTRRVRLSDEGVRFLRKLAEGRAGLAGLAIDDVDRRLLDRLRKNPKGLGLRGLEAGAEGPRLPELLARGYLEVGDEVSGRDADRTEPWLCAVPGQQAPTFTPRQQAKAVVWEALTAAGGQLRLGGLPDRQRTAAQALEKAGLARIERRPVPAEVPTAAPELAPALNPDQAAALAALTAGLGGERAFKAFLLQGVTGSGKTEVYLRLIAEARARGQGALVLVPEIALTPQLAARFRARFGDDVAVLHSGLLPTERRAAWRRLRAGEVGIALGARSAVFAPVHHLGVVVVDEEHDPSFKQEEGLRYNGRDLALVRAQRAGAVAVLGSATPSLESYRQAATGRYQRLLLPTRANPAAAARPLPPVEIIDLRREPPLGDGLFSRRLLEAVRETVARGEQVILFLNRRGFAPLVLCRACGQSLRCTQCAVAMTFHRARAELACHYCGRVAALPPRCPSCKAPRLEQLGMGTERVESVVRSYFPDARVARLDRDTAGSGKGGAPLERALAKVHRGEVDILVGTQMVTKGHDFPGVTLVGVLLPDQGMNLPDFRAAERTFQLLEQVAGRAGRAERPGRVMVQTYTPEHPAIACLPSHDYEGFVTGELVRRQEAGYPPFARLVAVRLEGADAAAVAVDAGVIAAASATGAGPVRIRGPAEAPIALLRGQTRWQVWLASEDRNALAAAARRAAAAPTSSGVRVAIDVDPHSVL